MRKSIKKSLIFFSLLIVIMLSTVLILPSMLFADTTTLNAIPGTNWNEFNLNPTQFTFDLTGIDISKIISANLKIWANNVEINTDNVSFNGTNVGQLTLGVPTGGNSLSEFNVLISLLNNGINTVVVTPYVNVINANDGDWLRVYQSELVIETSGGNISAATPLTPQEWVALDLNIKQLLDHYGPTSEGFIKMLYDNILGRVPDDSGLNYWTDQLNNNVFSASQIAEHFIFSGELSGKITAMSNEEFITCLYKYFLSRTPDTDGYNSWLSYINSGFSKEETLRAFLNNEEWFNICSMFNVTP
jgi:hypothetical protein